MDIDFTVPLSALQHYAFCPRQCALIHNEACWQDNSFTAIGKILHERVDSGEAETRNNIRYERSVMVSSERYRLTGKLDMLECVNNSDYIPVEYKKGKPKKDFTDAVQLCGGAICIEEMLQVAVKTGAIWYWGIRKRVEVPIDDALRSFTLKTVEAVAELFESGITPKAKYSKKCDSCSLYDECSPKLLTDNSNRYVDLLLQCDDL